MVAAQLPGVRYAAPPAGQGPALSPAPPRVIIIHATDNATATAADEASYAHTRPRSGATSAHFYVDGGEVLGSASLLQHAWGALSHGNAISWQVEICGRSGALPAAAVARAAGLVRDLARYGGIPLVKLSPTQVAGGGHGICGHADITLAYPQDGGTHTDPGWSAAAWAAFMAQVTGGGAMETPELAAALNASGNGWAAVQMIDPYEVPRPANTPGSTPVKVANPLAKAITAIQTDVAAIRAESGTVGLTDAQVAAIGAQVAAATQAALDAINARLTAIEDAVDKLMQAARAAGAAVG